jgi:hypothetical protein
MEATEDHVTLLNQQNVAQKQQIADLRADVKCLNDKLEKHLATLGQSSFGGQRMQKRHWMQGSITPAEVKLNAVASLQKTTIGGLMLDLQLQHVAEGWLIRLCSAQETKQLPWVIELCVRHPQANKPLWSAPAAYVSQTQSWSVQLTAPTFQAARDATGRVFVGATITFQDF